MFEIPFAEITSNAQKQKNPAEMSAVRLEKLMSIAKKLEQAEWLTEWTMTGLSFMPKYNGRDWEKAIMPANLRKSLDALGIDEEFRRSSSRTLLDVLAAKVEYADRVSYAETDYSIREIMDDESIFDKHDQQDVVEKLQAMLEMERLYSRKELVVQNDYQRGVLKGRLQTLEWLLGKEWPALDEDVEEWDREEAEEDRNDVIVSRAVETMHDVLFEEQESQSRTTEPSAAIQGSGETSQRQSVLAQKIAEFQAAPPGPMTMQIR